MNGNNELLGIISSAVHDMKAPLTSISGFAEAILDGTVPKENSAKYLEIIKSEADRLARMCSELLIASKIQSKTEIYEKKPFGFSESAREVVISLEKMIDDKKLNILFSSSPEDLTALGDKDSIKRVMYNICHNAIKFSPEKESIFIDIFSEDGCAFFRVKNLGSSMTEKEISNVFLPFYKTESTSTKSGTGLGMFISKSIIDSHEGKIIAESKENSTTFTFSIPLNGDI